MRPISLSERVKATHVGVFDDSLCGLELEDRSAFSVQYHPEAGSEPQYGAYLLGKFVTTLGASQ